MRRLITLALGGLLAIALAGACDTAESPVDPGTPGPFSSPQEQVPGPAGAPGESP